MKNAIAAHLKEEGHEVVDCGAHEYDALDDYPAFCVSCAEHVRDDEGSLGIVLGGSGNGEQMAANKVKGVRAVVCSEPYSAKLSR